MLGVSNKQIYGYMVLSQSGWSHTYSVDNDADLFELSTVVCEPFEVLVTLQSDDMLLCRTAHFRINVARSGGNV